MLILVNLSVRVHMHIIIRVTIVSDQGTSLVVAGEFDRGWVNGVDWSKISVSFMDNHGLILVEGGLSDLRVDLLVDFDVATNFGKLDAVGAGT